MQSKPSEAHPGQAIVGNYLKCYQVNAVNYSHANIRYHNGPEDLMTNA